MITGLMCHHNDTSRYIMLYVDTYEVAMNYIPTAFHATQDYGYRIPNDLTKLVEMLCVYQDLKEVAKLEQRRLKNQLFINRMENTARKMQCHSHEKCNKTKCFKVLQNMFIQTKHCHFGRVIFMHCEELYKIFCVFVFREICTQV